MTPPSRSTNHHGPSRVYALVREVIAVAKQTGWEWYEDDALRIAAALAFYTIFSLAPLVVIMTGIAGGLFGHEAAVNELAQQARQLMGDAGASIVRTVAARAGDMQGGPVAAMMGIGALLLASTAVFAELQSGLNKLWDVRAAPQRGMVSRWLRVRAISFALVLAAGFLLLVSLIVSAVFSAAQNMLTDVIPFATTLWRMTTEVVAFGFTTVVFMLIYKVLPDVQIEWRYVIIGGFSTALLFTAGKFLIGAYLGEVTTASAYGAAGSFVILLLWVYYSALVCLLGAEFTQVYARRYGSGLKPEPQAVRTHEKEH